MKKLWIKNGKTIFLISWILAISIPLGYLMGLHQPLAADLKFDFLFNHKGEGERVVHLVSPECQCSKNVLDYLVKRKTLPSTKEEVIIIGDDSAWKSSLTSAGFTVRNMQEKTAFDQYKIKSVPHLFVVNQKNEVQYSGGYSAKRRPASVSEFEDIQIIKKALSGSKEESRPIFGCANGQSLKSILDPFGYKYGEKK